MLAGEHNFVIWQQICIQSIAMSLYFDQQHDPNSNFAKLAKNGGTIQDGGSIFCNATLRVSNIFSIFVLNLIDVSKIQILWKKVF
jgi:hypothetical protein